MTDILRWGRNIVGLVVMICLAGAVMTLKVDASHARHREERSLAKKKRAAVQDDLSGIVSRIDPSSKSHFSVDPSPKTDVGREVVSLLKKDAELEASIKTDIHGLSINDMVKPTRLSTEPGRRQSDQELRRYDKAMDAYYRGKLAVRDGLGRLLTRIGEPVPQKLLILNGLFAKLSSKSKAVDQTTRELLDFVAQTKPYLSADKKTLVFEPRELAAFRKISGRQFASMAAYMVDYRSVQATADESTKELADQVARLRNRSS